MEGDLDEFWEPCWDGVSVNACCKAQLGKPVPPARPVGSARAPPGISRLSLAVPFRSESAESPDTAPSGVQAAEQPAVIPTQGDLLGDLLNLDLGPPVSGPPIATSSVQMGAVDLLGGGLDSLVRRSSTCSFPEAWLPWV